MENQTNALENGNSSELNTRCVAVVNCFIIWNIGELFKRWQSNSNNSGTRSEQQPFVLEMELITPQLLLIFFVCQRNFFSNFCSSNIESTFKWEHFQCSTQASDSVWAALLPPLCFPNSIESRNSYHIWLEFVADSLSPWQIELLAQKKEKTNFSQFQFDPVVHVFY